VAVRTVRGGHWSTRCAGSSKSGRSWYRIVSVNGKSVSRLYGRSSVYVATSLVKAVVVKIPLQAACDGVRLRTGTTTTAATKARLADGTKVTSSGAVSGGAWSGSCTDGTASGSTWYRITAVDGRSVSSLYGVSALYGAKSHFEPPATPTPTPQPTPRPGPDYIEGIDVSHWQGAIDWSSVAGAGKRFAFMKASDSTDYVDPTYVTNRAQAKANGLYIGAYHYARPDATDGDAVAEADHFVDTAAWVGGDLLPVLDLETTGGLGTARLQAWVQAFLDRVYERTGVRAMIYTSPSFWSNKMGNTQSFALGGYRTLWVAHWTTASSPTVPAANWGGNGWTFWQYTSDGSVPGISGRVDLDRYRIADFTPVLVK
jgi:GH25 family lysozyme M1 (1,4-beta-N-acetylmuramidase)